MGDLGDLGVQARNLGGGLVVLARTMGAAAPLARDIDGERERPLTTAFGDGGDDNSAGASFQVAGELAHGLVGRQLRRG